MPSDQQGPDLDRLVAEILGWTTLVPGPDWIMPEVLHWLRPCGKFQGSCPAFSTNPRRIEEMLAWLRKGKEVNIVVQIGVSDWGVSAVIVGRPKIARGDTIQHALARLVVAVAEA